MAYTSTQLKTLALNVKTNAKSALITAVNISDTMLRAGATNLPVQVVGDSGAVFSAQVTRSSDSRYYNFTTKTFLAATTSQSRLKNQSPGTFVLAIPAAASGDTYTVIIMAESHYGTRFSLGNGIRYAATVTQKGNADIVFAAAGTGINDTDIGTSTGSIVDSFSTAGSPTVVMSDLQLTVPAALSDYGFFITTTNNDIDLNNGTWNSGALYWQTGNYVANGAGTDSTALILDSVDDLYVGMQVSHVNSVYQTALRSITDINTTTKTVTLDGNETWSNDHVILFRAYGPRLIKSAIGIGLSLTSPTVKLGQTTTTVRTEFTSDISEGDDIAINGTTGIGKGATIRMRGVKKNSESGACTVLAVSSASITAGSITLTNGEIEASAARPVRVKTKIYIDGSSNLIYLSGTISVSKYPEANQNIYVDANKILTAGLAS